MTVPCWSRFLPDAFARCLAYACSGRTPSVPRQVGDLLLGKREYEANCAICHGALGKGDGPFAGMMTVRVPSLTALAKANGSMFPFARVYEIIEGAQVPKAHGAPGMMIWGDAYVTQRAGLKDDYGGALYDPAALARARTLALTEYIYRLQEK